VAGVTALRTPSLVFVWKVILIAHKLVSSTLLWISEMSKLYCEIHLVNSVRRLNVLKTLLNINTQSAPVQGDGKFKLKEIKTLKIRE
jgi:hypothetical protein